MWWNARAARRLGTVRASCDGAASATQIPRCCRSETTSTASCERSRGPRSHMHRNRGPRENGSCESFIRKLRHELPDREISQTLLEASVLVERWRRHYNRFRPHSAPGHRPPAPDAIEPLPPGPGCRGRTGLGSSALGRPIPTRALSEYRNTRERSSDSWTPPATSTGRSTS